MVKIKLTPKIKEISKRIGKTKEEIQEIVNNLKITEEMCQQCGLCCHYKSHRNVRGQIVYDPDKRCKHEASDGKCRIYERRFKYKFCGPNWMAILNEIAPCSCPYVKENWEILKDWYKCPVIPDECYTYWRRKIHERKMRKEMKQKFRKGELISPAKLIECAKEGRHVWEVFIPVNPFDYGKKLSAPAIPKMGKNCVYICGGSFELDELQEMSTVYSQDPDGNISAVYVAIEKAKENKSEKASIK